MSCFCAQYRTFEAVFFSSLFFGLVYSVYSVPVPIDKSSVHLVDPHKTLEVDFVDDNHSPDFSDTDYGLEMSSDDAGDSQQQNVSVWAATSIPFLLTIIGVILWCCCVYLRCQAEDDFKNITRTAYSRIH